MTLPYDYDAEAAGIGAILLYPTALSKVINILNPSDFYNSKNRLIYEQALALTHEGDPTDIVTMSYNLRGIDKLDFVGGDPGLFELTELATYEMKVPAHAKIVRKCARLRGLAQITASLDSIGEPGADPDEIEAKVMQELVSIQRESSDGGFVEPSVGVKEAFDHYTSSRARGNALTGITTGYSGLDRLTGGWQAGELTIMAARPSMGKTALALCCAYNCDLPVGFISIEMTRKQLFQRLFSLDSRVAAFRIKSGRTKENEHDDIKATAEHLKESKIYVNQSSFQTIFNIRGIATLMKMQKDIKVLFVDYLQLINEPDGRRSRNDNMGVVSRQLKSIAKDLDIAVVCLAQLNRDAAKEDRPKLHHLRDSGNIEQDADVVMMLWRKSYENESSDDTTTEVLIRKNRNGDTGKEELIFLKDQVKFVNKEG